MNRLSRKERIKKLFNKEVNVLKKDTMTVNITREVGPGIKLKLTTEDKENWDVLIATNNDSQYKSLKMTRQESRELANEILDMTGNL